MSEFRWASLSFSQKALDVAILWLALAVSSCLTSPGDAGQWWQAIQARFSRQLGAELLNQFLLIVGWIYCLSSIGLYGTRRLVHWRDDFRDVIRAVILCTAVIAALSQLFQRHWVTIEMLLLFGLFGVAFLFLFRILKWSFLRMARLSGRNLRHVIIVGAGPRGQQMAEVLSEHPELGFNLLGFVDDLPRPGVIGPIKDFARIINENVVDEVLIALPIKSFYEEIREIIRITEEQGIVVRIHSMLFDFHLTRARAEELDDIPVLTHYLGLPANWCTRCKRLIDFVGSLCLLILLSPLMLAIALLIKLTSPGPVLFVQERIGLHKRPFWMYKFRTMVADAEARQKELEALNEADGAAFKIRNDPRITSVGHFLRKSSLDELPQLFNVLIGNLSLVGPRPLPLRDFERFNAYWLNRRFSVKPGITCIWQVSGRDENNFNHWVEQDLEYIDHWSLLLDLKLLFLTVPAVLRGRGAV